MTVRFYSSIAQQTTLTASIAPATTVIALASTTGFPASTPFTLALDYNAPTEELVQVNSLAGLSATVTRAIDGTSATVHNAGAFVRHVSSARDFADSRTHENSSTGVHGLGITSAVVGTTDTQTLTNKTLDDPILIGSPSFEGATAATDVLDVQVTGDTTPRLSILADGTHNWGPGNAAADTALKRSGPITLEADAHLTARRAAVGQNALSAGVAGEANARFQVSSTGNVFFGPGGATVPVDSIIRQSAGVLQTNSTWRTLVPTTGTSALSVRSGADTQDRFRVDGLGQILFGSGTAAPDAAIQYSSPAGLNIVGTTNFNNPVIMQAGLQVFAGIGSVTNKVKGNPTSRSGVSVLVDPDLQMAISATAGLYRFEIHGFLEQNTVNAGINIGLVAPTGSIITWGGQGPHNTITTGSQAQTEWISRTDSAPSAMVIPFGNSANSMLNFSITGVCNNQISATAGTLGLAWGQRVNNAVSTTLGAYSTMRVEQIG